MDFLSKIKIAENNLIHSRGKTIYECADHVQKTHSYLCRIASLNEELPFPIEIAVPLMKFKKNFELLKAISIECGFIPVKLPRGKTSRGDELRVINQYNQSCNLAITALMDFLENPCDENMNKVDACLIDVIQQSVAIKKLCEKKNSKQQEFLL